MKKIALLQNTIQEYAWGSRNVISMLLNKHVPSKNPEAELWMGAHPRSPSYVIVDDTPLSLITYIESDPEGILGPYVAKKFSYKLPFLFKVLAAEKPLSIQAHPDRLQAHAGFVRENEKGIPINAPHRVYRDNNHKPEIICALTPFWALNGFRRFDEIIDVLQKSGSFSPNPSFVKKLDVFSRNPGTPGLKELFRSIMSMEGDERRESLDALLSYAEVHAGDNPSYKWILTLNKEYPDDIGIICVLLLNLVQLKPGEAMFLPARQFHSYLNGAGIELMANSDNVLRGGLTQKHIDIPELLSIIDFKESPVSILRPQKNNNHEKLYFTPAEEFILSCISLTSGRIYRSREKRSIEIMICIEGDAVIREKSYHDTLHLKRGTSIVIPACVKQYIIEGNANLYKAAVPIPE
jgi:mannose-6-phosphate isomerase